MKLSQFKLAACMAATCFAVALSGKAANAQSLCPTYRIVCQTVYEEQPTTTYRLEYETVYEEKQITTQKPVWETETRVRRYQVQKPVTETSTRVDRYTVRKAVMDTETRMQQRVVQRPVTEQVMQDQSYVTCEPVTTMRTQYVDQGSYVDQCVVQPGAVHNRLRWLQGGYVINPATGTTSWQRGGLHWVPEQGQGTTTVQRVYVPNVVACQVPETTYQQKVVTQQVPVTVTKLIDEVVEEPVQVQVCKYVDEVMERPVQVTTQRMELETREEPVQVQVCKWVSETRSVNVPHTVAKWVPHTTVRRIPRTVTMRVPIDTCNSCTSAYPSQVNYHYGAPSETIIQSPPAATIRNPSSVLLDSTTAPEDRQPTGEPQLDPSKLKKIETKKPAGEEAKAGDAAPVPAEKAGDQEPTPATKAGDDGVAPENDDDMA